jgi:hypothetical protein
MLDLWDRHGVKVTSHMIGEAGFSAIRSLPTRSSNAGTKPPGTVRVGVRNTR